MRSGWVFGISVSGALLVTQALQAQQVNDAPLPTPQLLLSCGSQCVSFTHAKPLKHDIPEFPRSEVSGFYNTNSEGYVWLRYTVGVDGKTYDVSKVYGLGNQEFSQRVIEAVRNWTFEPALMNGKPTVQSRSFQQIFSISNPSPVRPAILSAYKEAGALFDSGKLDEASAILQDALTGLRLSLLERAMLSLPLAKIAMRRKDYLEARRYALMVTLPGLKPLPDFLALGFWETLISADLMLGEFNDAFKAFDGLQRTSGFNSSSPYVDLINRARSQLKDAPQVVTQARIPPQGAENLVYWHSLNRRTFSFAAVVGSLDRYAMDCDQSVTESKISLTAEWRVPARWSNCTIYVYGAPGTTFRIVETNGEK